MFMSPANPLKTRGLSLPKIISKPFNKQLNRHFPPLPDSKIKHSAFVVLSRKIPRDDIYANVLNVVHIPGGDGRHFSRSLASI